MQNDYLDTQILLHEDEHQVLPDTTISGQIIFSPKIDLAVAKLGYQVVMQLEGKIYPESKNIAHVVFFRNKKVKKGKIYTYDIEFTTSSVSSYHSKNVIISFEIESIFELNTKSFLNVKNDYLKKNNLTYFNNFDPRDLLSKNKTLVILESKQPYTLELKSETIQKSPIWITSTSLGLLFLVAFFCAALELKNQFKILFATVGILFFLLVLPYLYKNRILDRIKVDTKPLDNNQFVVLLDLTRNWERIQKVSVNYSVIEEVMDQHGSDDHHIHKTQIYKSNSIEKHKIKMDKNDILDFPEITYDFIFDFPNKYIPTTLRMNNLKFIWKINITVYFFGGLSSSFIKNIIVKREQPKADF